MLTIFTVSSPDTTSPIGLATGHAVPASLTLARSWQLRDLSVLPEHRHRGVGGALLRAVGRPARADDVIRPSLMTEQDNTAALELYRALAFQSVLDLVTLSVDLTPGAAPV